MCFFSFERCKWEFLYARETMVVILTITNLVQVCLGFYKQLSNSHFYELTTNDKRPSKVGPLNMWSEGLFYEQATVVKSWICLKI